MIERAEVACTPARPPLDGAWDAGPWGAVAPLELSCFRPEGSDHRPRVQVKLLHDGSGIAVFFRVEDRYVRSVQTRLHGPVCTDSCVEWFVRPLPDRGYFNFEVNCGGTLHASFVEDPTRTPNGFRKWRPLSPEACARIAIAHSMPPVVDPEIPDPVTWTLQLQVPLAVFEEFLGPLGPLAGQQWQANFYKCGDHTSHRHWVSWAPVGKLDFHRPQDFAPMVFAR
ncbi:MAG: hypothetical protein BWZ02_02971 [Lentisphaerae bacterium ADurb.BinA184]|nr:MAG: hypothetical protein BWZ02_02971 [Lentisphaerae bacterium ADurb.BinA184]